MRPAIKFLIGSIEVRAETLADASALARILVENRPRRGHPRGYEQSLSVAAVTSMLLAELRSGRYSREQYLESLDFYHVVARSGSPYALAYRAAARELDDHGG